MSKIWVILTNDGGYDSVDELLSIYDWVKGEDVFPPFFYTREDAQNYIDTLFKMLPSLDISFPIEKEDCSIMNLEDIFIEQNKFLNEWKKKSLRGGG